MLYVEGPLPPVLGKEWYLVRAIPLFTIILPNKAKMPHCRGLQPRWLRSLLVPAACFSHILPLMGITYASQRGPLFHKTVYFLVQFASELCKLQKTIMFADWLLHWLCDFFMPSWQTSTQLAHIGRKWWGQQQEHQWPTLDKESPCSLPFLLSWHWQLFMNESGL